jgi:hypothetical protein
MKKRTSPKPPASPKPLPKLDAEGILKVLANVRELIPTLNKEEALPPRKRSNTDERLTSMPMTADAMEEFEYMAVIEGLESVAQDIGEALEQKHAKLVEDCLRVYHKMEELVLTGEHDELIPQVKDLRETYERTYGEPIPTPAEAERRAKKRVQELEKKKAERLGRVK